MEQKSREIRGTADRKEYLKYGLCRGQRDIKRGREMESMIMSGNIHLSIRIWISINNVLSQSIQ